MKKLPLEIPFGPFYYLLIGRPEPWIPHQQKVKWDETEREREKIPQIGISGLVDRMGSKGRKRGKLVLMMHSPPSSTASRVKPDNHSWQDTATVCERPVIVSKTQNDIVLHLLPYWSHFIPQQIIGQQKNKENNTKFRAMMGRRTES